MEYLTTQYPPNHNFTPQEINNLMADLILSQRETDRKIKEVNQRIGGLGNSWGDFLEGLAKPGLLEYFSDKGIEVHNIFSNVKEFRDNKKYYEIDLLLFNNKYVIAVEIKSKLTTENVERHIEQMKRIQEQPPHVFNLQGKTLIGAIAAISAEPDVIEFAIQSGFFILVQKSNLIEAINQPDFRPKEWKLDL